MLAAGTRAVVAPTRVVADDAAQAFVGALYEAIAGRGTAALPEAFQRAALVAVGTDALYPSGYWCSSECNKFHLSIPARETFT